MKGDGPRRLREFAQGFASPRMRPVEIAHNCLLRQRPQSRHCSQCYCVGARISIVAKCEKEDPPRFVSRSPADAS